MSRPSLLELDPSGLYLQLPGYPGAEGWFAGFTTRRAGGSLESVLSLMGQRGLPVFRPRQVHGDRILKVEDLDSPALSPGEADGLACRRRGVILAVAAADCVPLILFDPRTEAGAVVHSGWRGTLAFIAREAVAVLEGEWGSRPGDLRALLGPSIGPCCYRVGPEVAGSFRDAGLLAGESSRAPGDETFLDLPGLNRRILLDAGVPPERIAQCAMCTRCREDLFPSYRRDGQGAGRLLGFLGSVPLTGSGDGP
jgi:YfiH family protein